MVWFSKSWIAIAASRHERRKKSKRRTSTETFAERCIAKHLTRLGFVGQWRFGPGKRGRFRADFYHPVHRIVIEIDGASHQDRSEYDANRTRILMTHYAVRQVLRFPNAAVISKSQRKKIVAQIAKNLSTSKPHIECG